MRTRREQENIVKDWLEYIFEWFEKWSQEWQKKDYKNAIDDHTEQMLTQMDEAWQGKEFRFDIVWGYITRLRKINRTTTGGLLREPIILLHCAYAAARCKVYGEALKLCKQAYPRLTASKHWHGVALWMLGTLQWLYANQHDQALQSWERARVEDFEIEKGRYTGERGLWYKDRIDEMEIAILRGSLCNTIPPLYDIILPSGNNHGETNKKNDEENNEKQTQHNEEQVQRVQEWLRYLRKLWLQYYNLKEQSQKLREIIAQIPEERPENYDPREDEKTYPAVKQLIQLQEDRNEDFQSILHAMIEAALRIVEFDYFETARLLLIRVVRIHQKDQIYCLALWAVGCLEWIMDKSWAMRNWNDSYNTLRGGILGISNEEMTKAIRLAKENNMLPPLEEVMGVFQDK